MRKKNIKTQCHLKINCLAGMSFICAVFQFPACVRTRERISDVCSLVSHAPELHCKLTTNVRCVINKVFIMQHIPLATQALIHTAVLFNVPCNNVVRQGERTVACITYSLYGLCTLFVDLNAGNEKRLRRSRRHSGRFQSSC